MDENVNIGEVLANNYMLAKLNVRIWSGRKTDKKATAELLASKGAVSNAAAIVKQLLAGNDTKLKETAAAFTRIRTFFYEATVPWTTASVGAMKGDRLISTQKSIGFLGDFARLKKEAIDTLNDFIQEYDAAVQASAVSLGDLYDPSQYPHKTEIASMFGAEMALNPLPEAMCFDRLTNIPVELAAGLKNLYERNMEAQMDNALSDIQDRLLGELERMDTQLSKVVAGEKTRLFKSMTTNLKNLVDMARAINFTDNPEIIAIADGIEEHLLRYEVESYKDNAALAKESVINARKIIRRVKEDEVWSVSNQPAAPAPGVNKDEPQQLDFIEEIINDTPGGSEPSTEAEESLIEKNRKFLASLAAKNTVTKDEPEDNTPDFDDNEFMFMSN